VITHKRIFKDLFTFRASKGQRSWLDAHNVLAVMSLPYHLVITYTGLITLMFMYIPWGVSSQYGTDTQPFFDEVFAESPAPEPVGEPAELAALGGLVRQASVHWEGGVAGFITVLNPGDGAARVEMRQDNGLRIAVPTGGVTFDHQGQLLATPHTRGAAARTREVLYGLHLGRFAPPALRAVLFVVGLAGTAMVATGLILWQVKRASAGVGPPVGLRAVGVLNVALVAGLPMAMAGLFWANRLLPLDLAERAAWEIDVFFMVWAGALLLALVRADRRGWRWQLTGAALAFAGVPVLTAITTDRGLPGSLAQGDWAFALFDGAMLVFAALFAVAARLLAERPLAVANATVLARGGGA
jgi:uncharacterized iron-regulated membrane protein